MGKSATDVTPEVAEQRLMAKATERMKEQRSEDIVNPIELAKALEIKPQQVYNDIRNGRLEAVKHNNTQKIVIDWSVAVEYARRRFDRELQKQLKVEAELAGETVS